MTLFEKLATTDEIGKLNSILYRAVDSVAMSGKLAI